MFDSSRGPETGPGARKLDGEPIWIVKSLVGNCLRALRCSRHIIGEILQSKSYGNFRLSWIRSVLVLTSWRVHRLASAHSGDALIRRSGISSAGVTNGTQQSGGVLQQPWAISFLFVSFESAETPENASRSVPALPDDTFVVAAGRHEHRMLTVAGRRRPASRVRGRLQAIVSRQRMCCRGRAFW